MRSTWVHASLWPGSSTVREVDAVQTIEDNLSGLIYQPRNSSDSDPREIIWGVRNFPATLYKLLWNRSVWQSSQDDGWINGKRLLGFQNNNNPDTEGITKTVWNSDKIFICTEKAGQYNPNTNLSVLMYEIAGSSSNITPAAVWVFDEDFGVIRDNLGFEGIAWVPDEYLVSKGFVDKSSNNLYDPSLYPKHGEGLFFLGLESDGYIYVYSLDFISGGHHRLASFSSGSPFIVALDFDYDTGYLWSACDDRCGGTHHVHDISQNGNFELIATYDRPLGLGNFDNEGFTVTPESSCFNGYKSVYWADDDDNGGHSIREGTIPCGRFISGLWSSSSDSAALTTIEITVVAIGLFIGGAAAILYYRCRHGAKSEESDNEGTVNPPWWQNVL